MSTIARIGPPLLPLPYRACVRFTPDLSSAFRVQRPLDRASGRVETLPDVFGRPIWILGLEASCLYPPRRFDWRHQRSASAYSSTVAAIPSNHATRFGSRR